MLFHLLDPLHSYLEGPMVTAIQEYWFDEVVKQVK